MGHAWNWRNKWSANAKGTLLQDRVLTPRGMQMAGGPSGLAAMNRGGAQAPEMVVIQKYQHRAFSAFSADHVKLTNSPIRRAIKGQRKVGHRDT